MHRERHLFKVTSLLQFEEISFSDTKPGDKIYHFIRSHAQRSAKGPFTVVDPEIGRLRNDQGVEFNLSEKTIQLIREIN